MNQSTICVAHVLCLPLPFPHPHPAAILTSHPPTHALLQAPLETPLQPGATFGGLLDLRPQQGQQAMVVHQVSIMLETEEVSVFVCCVCRVACGCRPFSCMMHHRCTQ